MPCGSTPREARAAITIAISPRAHGPFSFIRTPPIKETVSRDRFPQVLPAESHLLTTQPGGWDAKPGDPPAHSEAFPRGAEASPRDTPSPRRAPARFRYTPRADEHPRIRPEMVPGRLDRAF